MDVWVLVEGDRWFRQETYSSEEKAMAQVIRSDPSARFVRDEIEPEILRVYTLNSPNEPAYTIIRYRVY